MFYYLSSPPPLLCSNEHHRVDCRHSVIDVLKGASRVKNFLNLFPRTILLQYSGSGRFNFPFFKVLPCSRFGSLNHAEKNVNSVRKYLLIRRILFNKWIKLRTQLTDNQLISEFDWYHLNDWWSFRWLITSGHLPLVTCQIETLSSNKQPVNYHTNYIVATLFL